MRIRLFYQSLFSDWNHGNAHFLRGIASELISRGHEVKIYEPLDSWSAENLLREYGQEAITRFERAFPHLKSTRYDPRGLDLNKALDGADLVMVHEWNSHEMVRRIGLHRMRVGGYTLLFHDTHHRMITSPGEMLSCDLSNYDGVLAFGAALKDVYKKNGWAGRAWTWHEAADTRVFRPIENEKTGDIVWIGNWGDGERTKELAEFFMGPVRELNLKAAAYGVRYPDHALETLKNSGIDYGGWIPNYEVPAVFSRYKMTVHIPRGPYTKALPGIPTIRPFEAMACGLPLISAPWEDVEGLFTPGRDYLQAKDGTEMKKHIRSILNDPGPALELGANGLRTVLNRHTCAHRVDELFEICRKIRMPEETDQMKERAIA